MQNYEEMYNHLRRLHSSTNDAALDLQERNKKLYEEIQLREEKLINAQKSLDINKEIMRNALTEQNRIQIEYGREIQELKEKIKKLTEENKKLKKG